MAEESIPKLLYLNDKGIIPGPNETAEQFLRRAEQCLEPVEDRRGRLAQALPISSDDVAAPETLKPALAITRELYGIAPDWVTVFYSSERLRPWHGACSWIIELPEQSPVVAIQLHPAFKTKDTYLGIYQRDEILAHEFAHAGRMLFDEPRFEEFFTYQASSGIRRWLGPLVVHHWEPLTFLVTLSLVVIADLWLTIAAAPLASQWLYLLPAGMAALGLIRLIRRTVTFNRCLARQGEGIKGASQHVVYRLTDREIDAIGNKGSTLAALTEATADTPRVQLLKAAYLPPQDC